MRLRDIDDGAFETWTEERDSYRPIPKNSRKFKVHPFYETAAWKDLRAKVLLAYGRVCMKCGTDREIQVDHVKARSRYPDLALEFSNLQVLCWPCNHEKGVDTRDYRKFILTPG